MQSWMAERKNMGRCRFTVAFDLHNMVPAPAAKAVLQAIFKTEDGILFGYSTATKAVLDARDDCAPAALILDTTNKRWYVNQGTKAVPDFQYLSSYTDA